MIPWVSGPQHFHCTYYQNYDRQIKYHGYLKLAVYLNNIYNAKCYILVHTLHPCYKISWLMICRKIINS